VSVAVAALRVAREPAEEEMEPLSWMLWCAARQIDAVRHALAELRLQAFARALLQWAAPYDAILTPALARAPVPHGTIDPCGPDPEQAYVRSGHFTPYTAICNVTGQPAVSLPLYERDDGLPLGVQLMGRPAQEGALLALAAQVERAQPWADRRPPVATVA
jgi:amidase